MPDVCGYTNTSASLLINQGHTLLYGLDLLVSTAGGDVTLYDGMDAGSGRKIIKAVGLANINNSIRYNTPVRCTNGLYLAIGATVSEVTVYWMPEPSE